MTEQTPTTSRPQRRAVALPTARLAALDAIVAAYTAASLLYVAWVGFDRGFVSVRRFSKPFLLLLVLASLRAAIPRPSWLSRLL